MKTWYRARLATVCGMCGVRYPKDTILLRFHRQGESWSLIRCPVCAQLDAPLDIPPLPAEYKREASGFVRLQAVATDWKQKAADPCD